MAFLTISDQSGDMEAVVFPNVLKENTIRCYTGEYLADRGEIGTAPRKEPIDYPKG